MSRGSQSWGELPLIAGVALTTFTALVLTGGNLGLAAAPVSGVAVVYAVWRLPVRTTTLLLLLLALTLDSSQGSPAEGRWQSPLLLAGTILLDNWSKTFRVPGLSFSGMDLLFLLILGTLLFRRLTGSGPDPSPSPTASCFQAALAFHALAILALWAWGLARGGDGWRSYWQLRQHFYVPLFAYLLSQVMDVRRDLALLGRLIVGSTLVRIAFGLYFYYVYCWPRGLEPDYITVHSDTIPFILTMILVGVRWIERPCRRHLKWCMAVMPLAFLAIFLNDRRLAYVGLLSTGGLIYALIPWTAAKRKLARIGLAALPAMVVYVTVGWGSQASLFKPVEAIRTMDGASDDASTLAREIENFNLAQTLRARPALGTGFGQPYDEPMRSMGVWSLDLYRYIPHNSVLWLVSVGGLLGFSAFWVLLVVGAYLAARSYRHARAPTDRAAALASLCTILLFLVLNWGDMGFQTWSGSLLLATALAVAGQLSVAVGAWPRSPALADRAQVPAELLEVHAWTARS